MKKTFLFVMAAIAVLAIGCKKGDGPAPLPDNSFTSFCFKADKNAKFLKQDVNGIIEGNGIVLTVPFGTRIDSLIADFTTQSDKCKVTAEINGVDSLQISGVNANDFSAIVEYLVTLDGKSTAYNVQVKNPLPADNWNLVYKHDCKAANVMMDFTKEGNPVLATLINAGSSRGPLVCITGASAVDTVVSATVNPCQYLAFGISPNGKKVIFSHDYASTSSSRKGKIYTSTGSGWTKENVNIDLSNASYGPWVGFYKEEAYVMTSNNANGSVDKRHINVTSCKNGTNWATGQELADRGGKGFTYCPIMASNGTNLYTFVTDMTSPTSMCVYKYDGSSWTEIFTISSEDPAIADYIYPANYAQSMVVTADETFYFAFGSAYDPRMARVFKYKNGTITLIGSPIAVGEDVAARYCRMAIDKDGKIFLAYRAGANNTPYTLYVTSLNEATQDWNTPCQLASGVDNINIAFNAAGEGYVSCSIDEFKTEEVTVPASVALYKLTK